MSQAFEQFRIYDAPGALAGQLLQGELSPRSAWNTFANPDLLTPEQRRSLDDAIRGGETGNTLLDTATGLATNPFVWMTFLTSPVGAQALRSGKSLFSVQKAYSAFQATHAPLLKWAMTPLQLFRGTAVPNAVLEINQRILALGQRSAAIVGPAEDALIARMEKMAGIKNLRAEMVEKNAHPLRAASYKKGSKAYQVVRDWQAAEHAIAHRLGDSYERTVTSADLQLKVKLPGSDELVPLDEVPVGGRAFKLTPQSKVAILSDLEGFKKQHANELRDLWYSEDGRHLHDSYETVKDFIDANQIQTVVDTVVTKTERVAENALLNGQLMKEIYDSYGEEAVAYRAAMTKDRQTAFVELIGDEGAYASTGAFVADDKKVKRLLAAIYRSSDDVNDRLVKWGATTPYGEEVLTTVFGTEKLRALSSKASLEEAAQAMRDELTKLVTPDNWGDASFMSRNTYAPMPVQVGGEYRPPRIQNEVERQSILQNPNSARAELPDRIAPLTPAEMTLHADDADYLMERFGRAAFTQEGLRSVAQLRKRAQREFENGGRSVMALRMDPVDSHYRYTKGVHETTAYDTTPISADLKKVHNETRPFITKEVRAANMRSRVSDTELRPVWEELTDDDDLSVGMLLDREYKAMSSIDHKEMMRTSVVPTALGQAGPEYLAVHQAQIRNKQMATWFANSWLGRQMEGWGTHGKEFIEGLREFGSWENKRSPNTFTRGIAGWLYTTHLGLNVSSMVLNLTQPLILAATIATPGQVMGAYRKAFGEMVEYASERMKMGKVFLTDDEKRGLIKKTMEWGDEMGIGPEMGNIFDQTLGRNSQTWLGRTQELMMKGFEKTEWLNRSVTAHLFADVSRKATGTVSRNDLHRFVLETQFGATDANTPLMFLKGPLRNPLMRQFMTFPLRSFVGIVDTFPRMGGEDYWKGLAKTAMRGMGYSAIVYEMGKGLVGADLSRGLFATAATDLFGGERLVEEGNEWVPVPPVLDIPVSVLRGVAQNDMALLGQSISRVIPGGVSLNRAMGIMPELPKTRLAGLPGRLQQTYVGWNEVGPDGMVPIYSATGTLVEYRSPTELVLKGLGADLGAFREQGALDQYLLKQRDEIVSERHALLRALRANDMAQVVRIQKRFEAKHGLPLTVNETQLKAFLRNTQVGRTERILDRLDPSVRPTYARVVADSNYARNVDWAASETAARASERQRRDGRDLQRELDELRQRLDSVGPAATSRSTAFGPF